MADLELIRTLVDGDHGLATLATTRADGTVSSSVVNAGVVDHPLTAKPVVGAVARGDSGKLRHLRARPHGAVNFRVGWDWAGVDGPVELIGPDDPVADLDEERVATLLRDIFTAAGGRHDDWETYDRVMAEERRTAVLMTPERVYSNR